MNSTKQAVEENASTKVGMVDLFQIIQNLLTLGLNSIGLWNEVLPKIKTDDRINSHPELLNLHLLLSQISQHLYAKVFEFFPNDLSQEKLPHLLEKKLPSKDIMKKIKPLLKKKNFIDKVFSSETSKMLYAAVEEILAPINCLAETESIANEGEITRDSSSRKAPETELKKSMKRKRADRSPSISVCSESESESSHPESASDSDSDGSDDFDRLFKIKSVKKGPLKIKQIFQTQRKGLRRKLSTPGEEGRFMVKIEVTDTKDLKKCSSSQYWTKVSTKTIFLTEPKSRRYKEIKSMLYSVGRDLKTTPGVECEEVKVDKKMK